MIDLAPDSSSAGDAQVQPDTAAGDPQAASDAATGAPCLVDLAIEILREPDPWKKAELTASASEIWKAGALPVAFPDANARAQLVPEHPARTGIVSIIDRMEQRKLGRAGNVASRQALLHNLVHIENWAVDLAWDVVARWGSDGELSAALPREFFSDFVAVAEDEARHFVMLEQRLEASGSRYGAFPAHDGLWNAAADTAHSLPARLAVEHCCHEARGLDVLPATINKFRSAGDEQTARLLSDVVYPEEVRHCAAGVRWLRHLHAEALKLRRAAEEEEEEEEEVRQRAECERQRDGQQRGGQQLEGQQREGQRQEDEQQCGKAAAAASLPAWAREATSFPTPQEWFHALVLRHYGNLKGPFNDEARQRAGFSRDWYEPLVAKKKEGAAAPGRRESGEGAAEAATSRGLAAAAAASGGF